MNPRLVLDTSIFVNPASSQAWGNSPTEAFVSFLAALERRPELEAYMPLSIYNELMFFAEEPKIDKKLLLRLQLKAPKKNELRIPGIFLYTLVEAMRDRIDRGLRLAERHTREALQAPRPPENLPKPERMRADAEPISRLRESYRRIMREGMLDSKADVDLLLLAYELEAQVVTADEGVILWAEHLGLSILPYSQLPSLVIP